MLAVRYPPLQSRASFLLFIQPLFYHVRRAIAACRAVIRLQAFNTSERGNSHNNSSLGDRVSTPPLGPGSSTGLVSFLPSYKTMKPQVHVIAERIMMDEFGYVLLGRLFERI